MDKIQISVEFISPFSFLIFLLLSLSTSSSSSAKLCSKNQTSSLLQFKTSFSISIAASSSCNINGLNSSFPKTDSWTEETDCCSWRGVKCDDITGQVLELDLSCSQLHGVINGGSSLFHLSALQKLNLAFNGFHGSEISPRFSQLKNLTYLHLGSTGFGGKIPVSIFNLPNLQFLNLSFNSNLSGFSGELSDQVAGATSLKTLSISNSGFNGEIPASLGKLKELTFLDFSCNNFSGGFPLTVLDHLQNLTHLDISKNNLTGGFPNPTALILPSLSLLDFSENQLVGPLPPWIYTLPSLQVLRLSQNKLTGSIGNFSKSLNNLDLSHNKFSGIIPDSVFHLINLTNLELQWNNLSGTVEIEKLTNLQNLKSLDLSHNHLSVISRTNSTNPMINLESLSMASCNLPEFPGFLNTTKNLIFLDLSNNKIHGGIPSWLYNVANHSLMFLNLTQNFLTAVDLTPLKHLGTIDLRSNLLQGPVPVLPPATTYFSISNNKFTGEIPEFICNMSLFRILDLSINRLSGEIPQCLGNFSNRLTVLDLRMNSFHGAIPGTFVEGNILRNLDLDGNNLEGPLPRSLALCSKLEVLDLGSNKINDTFPYWLETLPNLQVLVLRSNNFHGPIRSPQSTTPFPKLRIFDISNNHFSGLLPALYIQNLKAMKALDEGKTEVQYMGERYCQDTIIVTMKGMQTQLLRILTIFTTIDLSRNAFHGQIPDAIGALHSLRQLNLSHNSLSGHIPPSLGNLSVIESLDLSSNLLTGEIPRQLTGLTFLAMLDISHNRLSGPIPRGKQFDTFQNSSFVGNSGLCGSPLSRKCDGGEGTHHVVEDGEDEGLESGSKLVWVAIVVGYGCGLLFGILMSNFMLSAAKAKELLEMVEDRWYSSKWRMPFGRS